MEFICHLMLAILSRIHPIPVRSEFTHADDASQPNPATTLPRICICNMYGKEHFISMHTQQPHKPKEMPISFSKLLEGIVTTQTIRYPLFLSHLSICSPSFSSLLFSMRLTIENHFLHSCFCFAFVVLPRFPLPLYRYYKYL